MALYKQLILGFSMIALGQSVFAQDSKLTLTGFQTEKIVSGCSVTVTPGENDKKSGLPTINADISYYGKVPKSELERTLVFKNIVLKNQGYPGRYEAFALNVESVGGEFKKMEDKKHGYNLMATLFLQPEYANLLHLQIIGPVLGVFDGITCHLNTSPKNPEN